MFCETCGRILKDDEYICPECGRQCRPTPFQEERFTQSDSTFRLVQPIDPRTIFTSKYFIFSLVIGLIAGFAITYIWRFTPLIFCIPLFIPAGRRGIGIGLLLGTAIGCVMAVLMESVTLPFW